ncbi:MAG: hypothetical protein ACKO8Q_10935, partial [Bacteroidota bacterium]
SPHLGANIPLALQSTIYFLASFIPEASSFVTTKLERPAAMQLLCYQWGASNVLLPTEFAEFQNYLLTLGLPQLTRNIAIANGSGSGLLLYNDASKRLLDEHCNATNWMSGEELVFKLFPSPGSVDFEESTDYSNIIADLRFTEMSWDQWYSPINVFTQRPSVPVQTLPLDYSNGGYSTSVYELVKVFNNSGDFTESCGEINSDQYALKHCFVPLSSALLYSDVTPNVGYSAQASSFDYSIAASELNEPHSHLSWNHIEFLLNILADVDSQQMEYKLNNNQEVTVAHAENVLRPIDVNAGILNFSHENNNVVGEVVAVEMKSNCGEDNYFFRGDMQWNVGVEGANIFSKVSVEDSTRVNLLEYQKTRIEKNSLISLESGASLVIDGAEMLIKGKLVLNEGSELRLVSGSVFLDGGEIELNGGLIHVVDDFSIQQLELGGK